MGIKSLLLVACLVLLQASCSKKPETPTVDLAIPGTATIKDIMESHVDPSGDFVFESVQQIADDKGARTKSPQTDAEWAEVRHHLTVLATAPDYMVMVGRKAARPEDRSAFPDVENQPEEVQALMDSQHDDFVRRANALKAAAAVGLKAVDAKDPDALMQAALGVDHACESCHLHYWYPKDARARQAAIEEGVPLD